MHDEEEIGGGWQSTGLVGWCYVDCRSVMGDGGAKPTACEWLVCLKIKSNNGGDKAGPDMPGSAFRWEVTAGAGDRVGPWYSGISPCWLESKSISRGTKQGRQAE